MRLTVIFLTEEQYQRVSAPLRNYREMRRGEEVCARVFPSFPETPRNGTAMPVRAPCYGTLMPSFPYFPD